ncbi:MAG: hypothetical protein AAGL69_04055 [Pseudomonadota bacterium]
MNIARISVFTGLTCIALGAVAHGQTDVYDEIVVTGSRIGGYDSEAVPVVHIKRRPDFMVVDAFVESDSRDAERRTREISTVLNSLARRAESTPNITLGLSRSFETDDDDIEYVVDFDLDAVEIRGGSRVDTSRVTLVIKSPILDSDTTPDDVYARIESFIDSIDVSGRAVVKDYGDINYSLIGITQYREPLLKLIAKDAQRLREIFGEDYQMSFSGLEEPVRWRVSGAMQLAIYFPYSSSLIAD